MQASESPSETCLSRKFIAKLMYKFLFLKSIPMLLQRILCSLSPRERGGVREIFILRGEPKAHEQLSLFCEKTARIANNSTINGP
jgi:hypothetical protein